MEGFELFDMRLIHWINEQNEVQETVDLIKKDCKPFLNAIKYDFTKPPVILAYRGISLRSTGGGQAAKLKVRKNRRPLDTPLSVHNEIDNIFKKHFGWKARSDGLMVTGDKIVAGSYGNCYVVFPIGKFRFIYSHVVHDLYGRYVQYMTKIGHVTYAGGGKWKYNVSYPDKTKLGKSCSGKELVAIEKEVFQELDTLIKKFYNDVDLIGGLKSYNEIMIDCNEYYAIKENEWRNYNYTGSI